MAITAKDWPWQPTLTGPSLHLRPVTEADYEPLFAVASDPLIWELHPDRLRYTRERFDVYFRGAIDSRGALAIHDSETSRLIGSSRYTDHHLRTSSVEIGYTFLARECWGGMRNLELKTLMLNYAFNFVDVVYFVVGRDNLRSRGAMGKIGGVLVDDISTLPVAERKDPSVIFEITKARWTRETPAPVQVVLETARLRLEPVVKAHASELFELFGDPELHRYVPFEPISLEKQLERCARWEKRRSPDGREIWLNWLARAKDSRQVVGHFQVGIDQHGVAMIGYLVARTHQSKGLASEALRAIFDYLRDRFGVREVKAWTDTRNEASHRLADKLGMKQVELIKNADFFKGTSSDEIVFSLRLK